MCTSLTHDHTHLTEPQHNRLSDCLVELRHTALERFEISLGRKPNCIGSRRILPELRYAVSCLIATFSVILDNTGSLLIGLYLLASSRSSDL